MSNTLWRVVEGAVMDFNLSTAALTWHFAIRGFADDAAAIRLLDSLDARQSSLRG